MQRFFSSFIILTLNVLLAFYVYLFGYCVLYDCVNLILFPGVYLFYSLLIQCKQFQSFLTPITLPFLYEIFSLRENKKKNINDFCCLIGFS